VTEVIVSAFEDLRFCRKKSSQNNTLNITSFHGRLKTATLRLVLSLLLLVSSGSHCYVLSQWFTSSPASASDTRGCRPEESLPAEIPSDRVASFISISNASVEPVMAHSCQCRI
jgi:hypothetical protein